MTYLTLLMDSIEATLGSMWDADFLMQGLILLGFWMFHVKHVSLVGPRTG